MAILGVDGAGKSTIIRALVPQLRARAYSVEVRHLRPGWLPPLAQLKGHRPVQVGPVVNPHGSKPSGFLGSMFRLFYLLTDYVLGYWFMVRPRVRRSGRILLFDRYVYDMMLDPRRFRIALPARLIGLVTRLAPRPDVIICLHGDPQVVAARKSELPIGEVRRQVGALLAFAKAEPRAVAVPTDGTIEETRDHVLSIVEQRLARRR